MDIPEDTDQAMVDQLAAIGAVGLGYALQRTLKQVDAIHDVVTMQTREIAKLHGMLKGYQELKKRVDEAGKWAGDTEQRLKVLEGKK